MREDVETMKVRAETFREFLVWGESFGSCSALIICVDEFIAECLDFQTQLSGFTK